MGHVSHVFRDKDHWWCIYVVNQKRSLCLVGNCGQKQPPPLVPMAHGWTIPHLLLCLSAFPSYKLPFIYNASFHMFHDFPNVFPSQSSLINIGRPHRNSHMEIPQFVSHSKLQFLRECPGRWSQIVGWGTSTAGPCFRRLSFGPCCMTWEPRRLRGMGKAMGKTVWTQENHGKILELLVSGCLFSWDSMEFSGIYIISGKNKM